jgi:hypothetical protein
MVLAQGLRRSHGHLRLKHLILLSICTVLFALLLKYREKISSYFLAQSSNRVLVFTYALFSIFLGINHEIIYAHDNNFHLALKGILYTNGVYALYLLVRVYKKLSLGKWAFRIPFLLIGAAYLLVIPTSPKPHIDVWVFSEMASDYLLSGQNPYAQYYPDLYKGKYDLTHGFIYWPLSLYLYTASSLLGDVRWILVFIKLLEVFAIFKLMAHKESLTKNLAALAWLTFPVSFFVIEQSWTEEMIIPGIFWSAYFLKSKRWGLAAIALGVMCATKQYMIFLALLSFFFVLRVGGLRNALNYTGLSAATFFALFAPFLLWDAGLLWQKTVAEVLGMAPRIDSLSWVAYFQRFYQFYIGPTITAPLYLVTLAGLVIYLLKKKSLQAVDYSATLVVMFSVVFLFGKQAFCNYYFLLTAMLWCYLSMVVSVKGNEL